MSKMKRNALKKRKFGLSIEKRLTSVDMKISNTMQKECATIATIDMEEQRNHGIVLIKNYMLLECVRIAI